MSNRESESGTSPARSLIIPTSDTSERHLSQPRRPSAAQERFQRDERYSALAIETDGMEIIQRMASLDLAARDKLLPTNEKLLMGFITDENLGAGFALIGVLERGVATTARFRRTERDIRAAMRESRDHTKRKSKKRVKVQHDVMGTRNYFIVYPGKITSLSSKRAGSPF